MDLHQLPIRERIDWLLGLADRHGAAFRDEVATAARKHHQQRHPTAILVLKCMDGRVNIPAVTRTPFGVLTPFRNLGGRFDMGWPHLGEVLMRQVQGVLAEGRRVIILATYHFSKGDPARGCAGFNCDTRAAIAHVEGIHRQIQKVFDDPGLVYPLVCGFETDEDALVLHGANGEHLDLAAIDATGAPMLAAWLERLFPDMPLKMRADLTPLLLGNLEHVTAIRTQGARGADTLNIEHREWAICLGRGFDFLHTPNMALIIGPYSPDLSAPIRSAAGIIRANMHTGRIPADGLLLLTSASYSGGGLDRARAELKSRFLADFAGALIDKDFPDLAALMHRRIASLDWDTQHLELLHET